MSNKPLVLNNGVYLQSTEFRVESHLDYAHLCSVNAGKEKVTDLGIITPFITAGYIMKPQIYTFSNLGKNRVYVDGHKFKWGHPLAEEEFYVVEDLSGSDKPGLAGEDVKVKFNRRKYDNGYVLAIDSHDPIHVLVTQDEIVQDGDGFIYTLKLKTTDAHRKWIPKDYLRPGTKWFPITTIETEYSQQYSSIPEFTGGKREYFNTVGMSRAQIHYSVTREAAVSKISQDALLNVDQYKTVIEMYQFREGSIGYDINLQGRGPLPEYIKRAGGNFKKGQEMMKADIVAKAWVPRVEALGMALLEQFVEQEAIFGSGGLIDYDGKTKVPSSLGLFHQLNMGNFHVFNLYNFTLEKFEHILASRLKDRIEPFRNNVIKIRTGQGGYAMVKHWLRKLPSQGGFMLQGNEFLQNKGSNNQKMHWATPEIVSWDLSNGYGKVVFELAPALDPVDANPLVNPIVPLSNTIGGHRLSSYMFIIDDLTEFESDNIVELVYGYDWDITKRVNVGKLNYMGAPSYNGAFITSTPHHPGYEIFMEKRHKAYFLKDPTKSLLIKPINPFTNRPIFSVYFD